jgi:prevent-host-death family protein
MRDTYSVYEAKSRFSSIVRQVREGRSVVVTLHGQPVAEIRPIVSSGATLEERLSELAERGIVQPAATDAPGASIAVGQRKPGALRRFLEERGD